MTDILRLVANGAARLGHRYERNGCRPIGALKLLERPPLSGGGKWRLVCR